MSLLEEVIIAISAGVALVITMSVFWYFYFKNKRQFQLDKERIKQQSGKNLRDMYEHEELMRSLRWAAEMSVSHDVCKARLGIQEFKRLLSFDKLDKTERDLIFAALDASLDGARREIGQAGWFWRAPLSWRLTDAQIVAAKMIVNHNEHEGMETPPPIRKIAETVPRVQEKRSMSRLIPYHAATHAHP